MLKVRWTRAFKWKQRTNGLNSVRYRISFVGTDKSSDLVNIERTQHVSKVCSSPSFIIVSFGSVIWIRSYAAELVKYMILHKFRKISSIAVIGWLQQKSKVGFKRNSETALPNRLESPTPHYSQMLLYSAIVGILPIKKVNRRIRRLFHLMLGWL